MLIADGFRATTPTAMNFRTTPIHASADLMDSALAQLLFNRSRDPMWVLDVTGSVVRANDAARASFTGRRPVFCDVMNAALDHELPRSGQWTAMIPVYGEDEVAVEMNATLSSMDDAASHFLCTLQPATRRSIDQAEPDVTSLAADAQDAAPAMMWMAGSDVRRDWFSKPWLDFTALPLEAEQGEGWLTSVHPEDVERVRGISEASAQARYAFTLDYRLRRHDGAYRWVMDSCIPRYAGDGEFCGYVGSCIDIHERKELEDRLAERTRALRLADHRKDEFLAMLSHELRNPLAPIANAAGLLRLMEKDNPPLGRVRVIVERQVEQLRRLISDMVDMTRLTQHKILLSRQPVRVDSVVEAAVAALQSRIDAGGHSVELDMPASASEINADPARIQQAIGNLISNAAKFMQRPGIIRIGATSADGCLSLRVTDHGDGIEADFLPHVFDLFAQQDQSTARAHGGLGVGLTIALRIVQLHGGEMQAFSEGPGRGAEFVIKLPLHSRTTANLDGAADAMAPAPAATV